MKFSNGKFHMPLSFIFISLLLVSILFLVFADIKLCFASLHKLFTPLLDQIWSSFSFVWFSFKFLGEVVMILIELAKLGIFKTFNCLLCIFLLENG